MGIWGVTFCYYFADFVVVAKGTGSRLFRMRRSSKDGTSRGLYEIVEKWCHVLYPMFSINNDRGFRVSLF